MEQVTSRKNPLLMKVRKLAGGSGKVRREEQLYLGDGVKLLEEAVRWKAPLRTVVVSEGVAVPPVPDGVRVVVVPGDVMESISPMQTPQGALFLCQLPDTAPPEQLTGQRYLVLDGVQDPGNVGTIWRTADGLGIDGIFLMDGCASPYHPKTVRASMGACFRMPVWECSREELVRLLCRSQLPLYATALREDTIDVREVSMTRCAVVVGSEGQGVSQFLLEQSEKTLKIPIQERCESLNAAVAATVILWEMVRE